MMARFPEMRWKSSKSALSPWRRIPCLCWMNSAALFVLYAIPGLPNSAPHLLPSIRPCSMLKAFLSPMRWAVLLHGLLLMLSLSSAVGGIMTAISSVEIVRFTASITPSEIRTSILKSASLRTMDGSLAGLVRRCGLQDWTSTVGRIAALTTPATWPAWPDTSSAGNELRIELIEFDLVPQDDDNEERIHRSALRLHWILQELKV